MKITVENIQKEYPKIKINLPEELGKDEFDFVKDNLDLYSIDDPDTKEIKGYINTFISKLNKKLAQGDGNSATKKAKAKNDTNKEKKVGRNRTAKKAFLRKCELKQTVLMLP